MSDPGKHHRPRGHEGDDDINRCETSSLTSVAATAQDATQARCHRCGHVIVAPLSLQTGYGKKCRRMVELEGVDR